MTPPTTTHPETPEPQSTAPGRPVGADESLAIWLAARDGYDFEIELTEAERDIFRDEACGVFAGPLATLTADRDRLVRDLAAAKARIAELEAAQASD